MTKVGENMEFEIDTNKVIGQGSYGRVFECQSKFNISKFQLCAKVTKIFSDNNTSQEQQEKDMQREKQITEIVQRNKDNQNLVQVYYVKHDTWGSQLIVIMEKCVSNLDTEWKNKNVYQEFEVIDFLSQFLNGYRALYESNVIHRDIKPENILIQYIGDQKFYRLADFGIGRIYKLNDFKLTKTGTPFYASPELNSLIQDADLDKQFGLMKQEKQKSIVDIYSLGILLHQLVMGGYPCDPTPTGIRLFLNNIKTEKFKLKAKINSKLADLIERMIVYNPQERMTFDTLYEECNRLTMMRTPVKMPIFFKPPEQPNLSQQFPQQDGQPFQKKNNQQIPLNGNQNNSQNSLPFQPKFQQPFQFPPVNQNLNASQIPLLNIKEEIGNYLKKILKMHKNTLSPQCKNIFEDYVLERGGALLSQIGNLYTFDNTITYSPEEIQFYYCLKYGLKGEQQVCKKLYEDQKKDLFGQL